MEILVIGCGLVERGMDLEAGELRVLSCGQTTSYLRFYFLICEMGIMVDIS